MKSTINICEIMLIPLPKFLFNFVIMEATFLGYSTQDALSHAGAAGAIVLAFLLRIAMEWGKNALSPKSLLIQAITTIALCFVAIYLWHDFLNYSKGFEIYVFSCSLFSVFIVGEIEIVFKIGFRKWLKIGLVKLMASEDKEIEK